MFIVTTLAKYAKRFWHYIRHSISCYWLFCRLITIAADDQEVTLNVLSQIVPLTDDVSFLNYQFKIYN